MPSSETFIIRPATQSEKPQMEALITASVPALSREEYSPEQIRVALKTVFGVDSDLIRDGTYFAVEEQVRPGIIIACGGWSKRKTLFGGDQFSAREPEFLNPETDAAKIRAFFVHPDFARRGIGTLLLNHCEDAAKAAGFKKLELMATLPGEKLYRQYGFVAGGTVFHDAGDGVMIPFVPMVKSIR